MPLDYKTVGIIYIFLSKYLIITFFMPLDYKTIGNIYISELLYLIMGFKLSF